MGDFFFISAFPGRHGRPRKGETKEPLQAITIQLPPEFVRHLEITATYLGMKRQEAMRWALQEWVNRNHPLNAGQAAEDPSLYSTK